MVNRMYKVITLGFIAMAWLISLSAGNAHCDDFNCDYNLCDKANPCNRGCKCTYPQGAAVGYCKPWYQSKTSATVSATEVTAKKYTCSCEDPCSGSITCSTGCYAFCEENPEGSGRYVCIKGCASASLDQLPHEKFTASTNFSTVRLQGPTYIVMPMLKKLFGSQTIKRNLPSKGSTAFTSEVAATRHIDLHLTNTNLAGILDKIQ